MMEKGKILILMIAMVWAGTACQNNKSGGQQSTVPEGNYKVEIKEVIQANSYTYLRVEEFGTEYWVAVNKDDFKEGETVYYTNPMEMHNFDSRDLQRTFETIYFVQNISRQPIVQEPAGMPGAMGNNEPMKPVLNKIDVNIEQPEGGIAIGDLWTNKDNYKDQVVMVRGKVTKVNPSIMNRNWVHVQDGTGDDVNFDLTVTTNDLPEVGDVVTFRGTIAVAKDFGAGYAYDLIMEEAEIIDK
jgi:hypothetical protein